MSRIKKTRKRTKTSLFALGEPMIWFSGGALIICLFMILGLLGLVLYFGLSTFWPEQVTRVVMNDNRVYMGEVTRSESFIPEGEEAPQTRRLIRTGNFKLTQQHFVWVEDQKIKEETMPPWALVVERLEWGRFYGFPESFVYVEAYVEEKFGDGSYKSPDQKRKEIRTLTQRLTPKYGGVFHVLSYDPDRLYPLEIHSLSDLDSVSDIYGLAEVVQGAESAFDLYNKYFPKVAKYRDQRRDLEKHDTGDVNRIQEEARLELKEAELDLKKTRDKDGLTSAAYKEAETVMVEAAASYRKVKTWADEEFAHIRARINEINLKNGRYLLALSTPGEGAVSPENVILRLDEMVAAYPANKLSFWGRIGIYLDRWVEYLVDEPREANSEGGVFPAIFGTVLMTLLMALAVAPFGVLTALYLREYAKSGFLVSIVRVAVNNLAGVPSIVFGVFGLGFFCYGVGGFIDGGPSYRLPEMTWFFLLGGCVLTGALAFICLIGGMRHIGSESTLKQRIMSRLSLVLWAASAVAVLVLVAFTPFFDGFYSARLPNPTFGKGALIWASFTLALMTLPVVIVATEEALSAVPNSMREGSYACGAGKWQTIRRIVLPRAMPGVMTGMILAMARGAGEVAPLMLVGAVKMAPELPIEWSIPFGVNRSFMHLGFHIYDVGFQSQNSEAAKPMVFTTTLLLVLIIAILNISVIWLRTRLRRRFVSDKF